MHSLAHKELELKLELTPQELQRVGAHPALEGLTVGKPVTRTVRSIYFDTPDHRLRAQGISLRLRSIGDQWLQTIKAGGELKNGVADRGELEVMVDGPEPDLSSIDHAKVRRRIEKALKTSTLEAQFETIVTRTSRKLHSEKGDLELALDEGVVRAAGTEDKLCEAELELKTGSPDCLLETATALFSSEPIRLARVSKAERGYNLVLGRHDEGLAPQKAKHLTLRGDETCAQALSMFLESADAQVTGNRRAILETDDPEAAHQLRIGLRRLRSALRAFRPLSDSQAIRELEHHARAVAQSAGELRDADVLIDHIYAPVAGKMKSEPGFGELRAALLAHRSKKREEARAALSGEQWSKVRLFLALWPRTMQDDKGLQAPVSEFASVALGKAWKKIKKQGEEIETLSLEQRHEMRKSLKSFRYLVEFFGSLYERDSVGSFVKDLKKLQDVFGYVNDVASAGQINTICHTRCADNREAQRAAGYVLGWHQAQSGHCWKAAAKGWSRLAKRDRFWS